MEDLLVGLIVFAPLLLFILIFFVTEILLIKQRENKESEIDWKGIQEEIETINKLNKVKESENTFEDQKETNSKPKVYKSNFTNKKSPIWPLASIEVPPNKEKEDNLEELLSIDNNTIAKKVFENKLEINRVYKKINIYKIFDVSKDQRGEKWRNGYCEHNNYFFIFANIKIPGVKYTSKDYKNIINEENELEWEAQNNSKISWESIQNLKKSNPYIFVRYIDFRSGIYKFIGVGECIEIKNTSPVYFRWKIHYLPYLNSNYISKTKKSISYKNVSSQYEQIKKKEKVEKEVKKVIDKTNLSISKSENKSKLLNKDALRKIFNEVVKNNFNIYNINENPFKIKSINNRNTKKSYWVFLKNISPAYFANPDVSRIQIANKPIFKKIQEQKELCIPIGYDSENKTFVIWNPKLFLERILNNENISIYSRFSEQANLTESYKDFKLTNDEKVFVVQSTFLSIFLINIMSYFEITDNALITKKNTSLSPLRKILTNKDIDEVNQILKNGKASKSKALSIIMDNNKNLTLSECHDLLKKQKSFLNIT